MDGYALAALAIVGGFIYFVARLGRMVVGTSRVVRRATREAEAALAHELDGLSTSQIRQRIVEDPYLLALRASPSIQRFVDRVSRGDEAALVQEYSRTRLYGELSRAEHVAGGTGRPEAVDAVNWLWPYLVALNARKERAASESGRR